jgi:hypothetical protein
MNDTSYFADSEIDAQAFKHLLFRGAVAGGLMTAYSVGYLGNSISPQVLTNSAIVAGSALASETAVKYIAPHIIHAKSQGINGLGMMGAEAALSGVIYSQVFPQFYGNAVGMQELAMVGGAVDLAAQITAPRLAAFMNPDQQSY